MLLAKCGMILNLSYQWCCGSSTHDMHVCVLCCGAVLQGMHALGAHCVNAVLPMAEFNF